MRHILIYESFGSSDFYEKVGYYPPNNLNLVEFTDVEIKSIKNAFDIKNILYGSVLDGHRFRVTFGRSPNKGVYTTLYKLDITKSNDEWYYAVLHYSGAYIGKDSECYKCDQIGGVVKLIDDLVKKFSSHEWRRRQGLGDLTLNGLKIY